jgi:hypothetical protein
MSKRQEAQSIELSNYCRTKKQEISLFVVIDLPELIFDNLPQNIEPVNIESIRYFQKEVKKITNWLFSLEGIE